MAAGGLRTLALPRGEIAHAGAGDERGEVAVAPLVLREEREGMAVHDQLRADDRLDALAAGLEHEAYDAAEVGRVGEAKRAIPEGGRPLHQRLGGDGAGAKGEGAVGP